MLFTPAASKLFPFCKAICAPSSIFKHPLVFKVLAIHFFLASNFEILGTNQVHICLSKMFIKGLSFKPLAIAILHPDISQILAASILVLMPPDPYSLVLPDANSIIF